MSKETIIINGASGGGISKAVTAGYGKFYAASLLNFGASGTFIMEREMKEYEIINPSRDETAQAVKANYGRMSYANAVHTDTRKATFIMEKRKKILVNGTENCLARAVRATYGKTKTSAALCGYNSKPTLVMEQQKALELAEAICSKLRGGRGFAAMGEDGTIRGQFKGERNSSISEAQYQYEDNVAQTLTTAHEPKCYGEITWWWWRIRKFTPRECFRLMDVDDTDIDKIQAAGIPKTQQYKLAGNSIVCSCLFHIFRKMFVEQANESRQQTLF